MNKMVEMLKARFEVLSDPEKAHWQKAYLRNQFDFFGTDRIEQEVVRKEFFAEFGMPDQHETEAFIRELWELPQREFQYFGLFLIEKVIKKVEKDFISLLEYMITTKSWWDTVDMIATHHVGVLFRRFPELIPVYVTKWMDSENLWLERTALLFQLKYKDKTNTALLFDLIHQLAGHKDFFIRKAIGWALREYSKTSPEAVIHFLNNIDLSPLSTREALKVINRKASNH
ncbi:MAG: DNA alkylation repair protein [Bacteroidales bacterium]|nr:DNA alkylation repair protein [Bacteroidales bacterium]